MKLLADENLDGTVVALLRDAGHEVLAVAEMEPGISDDVVLQRANLEEAMLLTEDKDFGELAFRQFLIHRGVILIRLAGLPAATKAAMMIELLEAHGSELPHAFTVMTPGMARIRKRELPGDL